MIHLLYQNPNQLGWDDILYYDDYSTKYSFALQQRIGLFRHRAFRWFIDRAVELSENRTSFDNINERDIIVKAKKLLMFMAGMNSKYSSWSEEDMVKLIEAIESQIPLDKDITPAGEKHLI